MRQYIEIDPFGNVTGFVNAEEPPVEPGRRFEVQDPPVTAFPQQPFSRAILRRTDGVTYWFDPRTTEEKAADARARRTAALLASDWIVTRAYELGQAVPLGWATYRQALRDVPSQADFPLSIDWPTPPES